MKEFDSKLKEETQKIELRDFSQVWSEIQDRIEEPQVEQEKPVKTRIKRFWATLMSGVAACLILVCAVCIPLMLNKPDDPMVFYVDELTQTAVSENQFYSDITSSGIAVVDLTRYTGQGFRIIKTSDNFIKGGKIEFFKEVNTSAYLIDLKFYSNDVVVSEDTIVYDLTYTVNGATIEYTLTSDDGGFWIYDVKANYNSVNYFMNITALNQDVTLFFNEFFI